jgi:hypothetical protein
VSASGPACTLFFEHHDDLTGAWITLLEVRKVPVDRGGCWLVAQELSDPKRRR